MVQIPSTADIAAKWERRASSAQNEFRQGVEASSDEEWASGTIQQQDAWAQGVQEAAANGRFAAGVQNTTKSWEQRTLDLGVTRYPTGISSSQDEYAAGFDPYHDLIAQETLSPRGPRGDPGNYDRVRELGTALHNLRMNL